MRDTLLSLRTGPPELPLLMAASICTQRRFRVAEGEGRDGKGTVRIHRQFHTGYDTFQVEKRLK